MRAISREENRALAEKIAINIITICPALILAARRNDSVIGRTEILVDSIITKNGFSQLGAPLGRRWARNSMGFDVIEDIIRLNQRGRPKESVNKR